MQQGRGGGYGGGGGDQQQRGGYGGGQKRGRDEEAQQPVDDAKRFLVKRLMTLGDRPQVRMIIDRSRVGWDRRRVWATYAAMWPCTCVTVQGAGYEDGGSANAEEAFEETLKLCRREIDGKNDDVSRRCMGYKFCVSCYGTCAFMGELSRRVHAISRLAERQSLPALAERCSRDAFSCPPRYLPDPPLSSPPSLSAQLVELLLDCVVEVPTKTPHYALLMGEERLVSQLCGDSGGNVWNVGGGGGTSKGGDTVLISMGRMRCWLGCVTRFGELGDDGG